MKVFISWPAPKDAAMWLTWKHQDSDFVQPITVETIENKIEIFYERQESGHFLNVPAS